MMPITAPHRTHPRADLVPAHPARPEQRSPDHMALTANHMPATADDAARHLRERMELLVHRGGAAVHRIGGARTSVRFRVAGDRGASFVLLADRRPPEVVDADEPAEIELRLSPAQAVSLAVGELVLPIEIMGVNVEYDGPVRKYLDIDPILRAMLAHEDPR